MRPLAEQVETSHLDENGRVVPTHDTDAAKLAREHMPKMHYCMRCGLPWGLVEGHTTHYTKGYGCFPLCEGCWELLGCAEARIEYYVTLVAWWAHIGCPVSQDTAQDIYKAVANGL